MYAFDADVAGITYWHDRLGMPSTPSCSDLTPVVGITGTPVIDPDTGTIHVDTKLAAGPSHRLHALDITSGIEKFGGPLTVTNTGFTASIEHQRPGLLLLSNVVYLAFGSHCDQNSYHGFMFGYNATNLAEGPQSIVSTRRPPAARERSGRAAWRRQSTRMDTFTSRPATAAPTM